MILTIFYKYKSNTNYSLTEKHHQILLPGKILNELYNTAER